MRAHRFVGAAVVALGALSCGLAEPAVDTPTVTYVNQAIDLMQSRAFYRRRVKWDSVRADARAKAAGLTTTAATYPIIRQALLALGDHHSFLQLPLSTQSSGDVATAGRRVDSLDADFLGGRFGFVHVPKFSQTVPGSSITSLADSLQALIRGVDARDPCGWIVDLRHNSGGNMWPMLAGVGPILGEDNKVGFFVDADSLITTWYYTNGGAGPISSSGQRSLQAQTSRSAYVLRRANQPIAVLTDSLTASSGEAITVAFRGLARARSCGGATAGVPTANAGFPLSDGATLLLMVALDADRNSNWYSTRIVPDEPIFLATYPATDDAIVNAAMNWLATRPGCS